MKKVVVTLLIALGAVWGGCSQQQEPKQSQSTATPVVQEAAKEPQSERSATPAVPENNTDKFTIGMSQCNLGEPWRVQMNADIAKAAESHDNLDVIFKDAQNDTLKQRAHIEEFLSQGVDLLIVSPKEPALKEAIAKVYRAGTPVIILDRDVPGEEFTQFIGANNYLIGKAAGEYIKSHLKGEGNVVELKGLMTTIPGQDRNRGFREGIAGSKIEIIFEADMQWLEPNARKEMDSALARFEDIDLVYAHNDPGAHGAYLAAKAAGREKDIAFVGIDALPHEGQAYVKEGILDATLLYPTGGAEAIENALKILNGEEVPKKIVLDSRLFSKASIDAGGEFLRLGDQTSPAPQPAAAPADAEAAEVDEAAKALKMQGKHAAPPGEAPADAAPAPVHAEKEDSAEPAPGGVGEEQREIMDAPPSDEGLNKDTSELEKSLHNDPLDKDNSELEKSLHNDPLDSVPNEK